MRRKRKPTFKPNPDAKTTYELKREKAIPKTERCQNRKRPKAAPPKVLPPEYVAAQNAPWTFPEKHPNANTGKWNLRDEGD